MRKIPPMTAVRVFEAAARHENFTKAAAELGMTQAAVSYQIRLLEQRLGDGLFLRDKGRVRLSDAGRRIAPTLSAAFDAIDDAFASLTAEGDTVLTISTTQTLASNWLAPRLGGFQVSRPELAVRLRADNRMVDLAGEGVDVAIRTGSGTWSGLRSHFMFQIYSQPMGTPEFLERHKVVEPADVLKVPRIGAGDVWWRRWLETAGVRPEDERRPPGIWLDSQVMEGNAALAGQGLAILCPIFWKRELADGRLIAPFPRISSFDGLYYWLAYPEHKRNQPKIRAFRDWLQAETAADAAHGPAEVFQPPKDSPSD